MLEENVKSERVPTCGGVFVYVFPLAHMVRVPPWCAFWRRKHSVELFSRPLPQWRDSRWWGVPGSDTWSVAGYRFLRSPFLKLPPRGAVEACVCAHWKTDSKWKIEKVIVLPPRTDFPTFIRGGKGGGVICDCTWTQTHTHTRNKINLKFKIIGGLNP